jgi:hypothetical protein
MDFWILAGVTMLVGWGWITFTTTAPGWLHLLLTAGVFLVIWRIVVRGTPESAAPPPSVRPDRKR